MNSCCGSAAGTLSARLSAKRKPEAEEIKEKEKRPRRLTDITLFPKVESDRDEIAKASSVGFDILRECKKKYDEACTDYMKAIQDVQEQMWDELQVKVDQRIKEEVTKMSLSSCSACGRSGSSEGQQAEDSPK